MVSHIQDSECQVNNRYHCSAQAAPAEPTPNRGIGHHINCGVEGQGFKPCLPSICFYIRFVLKNSHGCVVHPSGLVWS